MADPLTPPAQGSAEVRGALHVGEPPVSTCDSSRTGKRSVAEPPVSTCVSSRTGKRSVAKPPVSLQVGFYNIGWTDTQLSGQNHEMHRKQLGRDCARAFESYDLGMLCLCEVGSNKLDKNPDAHLGNSAGFEKNYPLQDVNIWLEHAIQEWCETSIDLQANVLGPYAIVLNKSVCCFESYPRLTGALVDYPGTDHTYRRAVHSVIQVLPHGPLIDVWVHHAPSSKARGYPPLAREQTMEYFFDNVSGNGIVGGV